MYLHLIDHLMINRVIFHMEVGNVITILENDIQAGECVYRTQAPLGYKRTRTQRRRDRRACKYAANEYVGLFK